MQRIIDWQSEIYVGQHVVNQTPAGYIAALTECMERFGRPDKYSIWVCTDYFGFGKGYNHTENYIGFSTDIFTFVNRAFNFEGRNELISGYHNYKPKYKSFNVSGFISSLTSDYTPPHSTLI